MSGYGKKMGVAAAALAAALAVVPAAGCRRQAAEAPAPKGEAARETAAGPGERPATGGLARDVAATVNGEAIRRETLEEAIRELRQGTSHGITARQVLDEMITAEVLRQEAVRRGLEKDPDVREAVRRHERYSLALLYQETLRREYVSSREVDVEGIDALLRAKSEPVYDAEVILVPNREDSLAVYERLRAGEDFGDLARELSIGITASLGGQLGLRPDAYFKSMFGFSVADLKMPAGTVSNPIETKVGFVILKYRGRKESAGMEREFQRAIEEAQERAGGRTFDQEILPEMMRKIPAEWNRAYLEDGTITGIRIEGRPADLPKGVYARLGKLELNTETITARFPDLLTPKYAQNLGRILEVMILEDFLYGEAISKRPELRETPDFQRRFARQKAFLLRKRLIADEVEAKIRVDDDEVAQYYRENRELFLHGPQWELSHIFVPTREDAEQVVKEYRKGIDFAHLALRYSKDSYREKGGYVGIVGRGALIPPLDGALEGLKAENAISAPIKSDKGYHVLKANRLIPAANKTLEDARKEIAGTLQERKLATGLKAFQEQLRTRATIVLNEPLVTELEEKSRKGGGHGI